jgi:hypothetical protein
MVNVESKGINVREATASDAQWLKSLVNEMYNLGHLIDNDLAGKIDWIIAGNPFRLNKLSADEYRCEVWVAELKNIPVGAAIVKMSVDKVSLSQLPPIKHEIWVFGIREGNRGHGYWKKLLRYTMDKYAKPGLYIRCTAKSEAFMNCAQSLGFVKTKQEEDIGTRLVWPKPRKSSFFIRAVNFFINFAR